MTLHLPRLNRAIRTCTSELLFTQPNHRLNTVGMCILERNVLHRLLDAPYVNVGVQARRNSVCAIGAETDIVDAGAVEDPMCDFEGFRCEVVNLDLAIRLAGSKERELRVKGESADSRTVVGEGVGLGKVRRGESVEVDFAVFSSDGDEGSVCGDGGGGRGIGGCVVSFGVVGRDNVDTVSACDDDYSVLRCCAALRLA